jgi:integrase
MRLDYAIEKYIDYRRKSGEKFESAPRLLNLISKSLGKGTLLSDVSRQDCIDLLYGKAAKGDRISAYWFNLYAVLDGLFKWALVRNYIGINPLPSDKPQRPQPFVPYIYNRDELKLLFMNATTYRRWFAKNHPQAIQGIIMLTYLLGLRPGETLRIELSDIHLANENYILIKDTKFYKSRIVPFNDKVEEYLKFFLEWRIAKKLPLESNAKLFLDQVGNPYSLSAMQKAFTKIREKSEIYRYDGARYQPRLEDLRHSFATHRIVSWYREGKNVQDLLPVLSTYLGHGSINSTAVYISFTDALLLEASDRFESYLK